MIPPQYTCNGLNIPIDDRRASCKHKSLAIIVDDSDAPSDAIAIGSYGIFFPKQLYRKIAFLASKAEILWGKI
jgi:phosphatidylethanolamine-binding protein (PEBP) family uncharacterized protein